MKPRRLVGYSSTRHLGELIATSPNLELRVAGHLRTQGISFAVFAADARTPTASARDQLLARLTAKARLSGMCVDKAALCYRSCGRVDFYGPPDLVRYLSSSGVPRWTHTIAA